MSDQEQLLAARVAELELSLEAARRRVAEAEAGRERLAAMAVRIARAADALAPSKRAEPGFEELFRRIVDLDEGARSP